MGGRGGTLTGTKDLMRRSGVGVIVRVLAQWPPLPRTPLLYSCPQSEQRPAASPSQATVTHTSPSPRRPATASSILHHQMFYAPQTLLAVRVIGLKLGFLQFNLIKELFTVPSAQTYR